jgi:lipoprotein LpqH
VKRGLLVAVGGAAILIAGVSGCSSEKKSETSSSSSSSASESSSAAASPGGTKVTIDGQEKTVGGSTVCASMGGNLNVAIGEAMTGITAVMSDGDSPSVTSVALGNVNGVTLAVGAGQGDAKAAKDGKSYKISGDAVGVDLANPMTPVNKPFTLEFTCP